MMRAFRCHECGHNLTTVTHSRAQEEPLRHVHRVRKCLRCDASFATKEFAFDRKHDCVFAATGLPDDIVAAFKTIARAYQRDVEGDV